MPTTEKLVPFSTLIPNHDDLTSTKSLKRLIDKKELEKALEVINETKCLEVKPSRPPWWEIVIQEPRNPPHRIQIRPKQLNTIITCSCEFPSNMEYRKKKCRHLALVLLLAPKLSVSIHLDEARQHDFLTRISESKTAKELKLDGPLVLSVLEEIESYLLEQVTLGLQRVSNASLDLLKSLVTKCQMARLPALKRTLNRLMSSTERYVQKDTEFSGRYHLRLLHQCWLQVMMIKKVLQNEPLPEGVTPVDIIGEMKAASEKIGSLELHILGINAWEAQDQYLGLQAYFCPTARFKWSLPWPFVVINVVYPAHVVYSHEQLYSLRLPSDDSLRDLAHGVIEFMNPSINEKAAMSMKKDLVTRQLGTVGYDAAIPRSLAYDDWQRLIEAFRQQEVSLKWYFVYKLPFIVVIEPKGWGTDLEFDPITNAWTATLLDKNDRMLTLFLRNNDINQKTISNLIQCYKKDRLPDAVSGRVFVRNRQLLFEPMTGFFRAGIRLKGEDYLEFHFQCEDVKAVTWNE